MVVKNVKVKLSSRGYTISTNFKDNPKEGEVIYYAGDEKSKIVIIYQEGSGGNE